MLNFCIFVFIIYAVASSVRAILRGDFLQNVVMFAKAFKNIENKNKNPEEKPKIVRINQCKNQEKITKISNQTKRAA